MRNQILYFLLALTTIASGLQAQDQVQLTIPDVSLTSGDSICVPIIADSFPDIVSAQFSLGWDTSIIAFSRIEFGSNPLGLSLSSFFSPTEDVLNFSWFNPTTQGITVASGTPIFEVCFNAVAEEGSTDLVFGAGVNAEFVQEGIFMPFPSVLFNGSVTVSPQNNLSMLPGDTNLDSLVNADDILNIGLGFGSTGPARSNPMTDFSFQTAPAWSVATPMSQVDYAHLDADGNGTINENDAAIVLNNFGESMLGLAPNQQESPESSMPFIYTDIESVQGGQMSSIPFYLGDTDNPVNAGYGVAFSVQFSPTQFDLSTISVDYNGTFLGDELLTFAELFPNEPGLLEIAAVRKDQQNSTEAGGLICTINIQPLPLFDNQTASLFVTPYRYIDAEENETNLVQAISEFTILSPSTTQEPSWAADLTISPNPSSDGRLFLNGLTNEVARIELANAQGQILTTQPANNGVLNLANVASGTYFLRFIGQEGVATRKVIVAHH